jgi:hypothetical protein
MIRDSFINNLIKKGIQVCVYIETLLSLIEIKKGKYK